MGRWNKGSHGHEHNWKLKVDFLSNLVEVEPDAWGNNAGFYTRRYWQCIRGGKVKHTYIENVERSLNIIRASGTYDWGKV